MISLKSFLFVLQSWYWCNFCSGKYHVQFSASSSGISNLIETWIKHLFRLPTYCIMYIARSKLLNRAITFPHPVTRTLPSTWTLYRVNPQLLSFLLTTKLLVNLHHHCLQIFSIEYPAFPPPPSPSCAPLTLLLEYSPQCTASQQQQLLEVYLSTNINHFTKTRTHHRVSSSRIRQQQVLLVPILWQSQSPGSEMHKSHPAEIWNVVTWIYYWLSKIFLFVITSCMIMTLKMNNFLSSAQYES